MKDRGQVVERARARSDYPSAQRAWRRARADRHHDPRAQSLALW